MSVDFNSTPQNNPTTNESETPMFDAPSDAFAGAPAYASRSVKKRGGAAPIAIAAGIIAIGGLAAAGWYATQPHESGVAQLTPGTETTTASTAVAPPPEMAANTAPIRAPDAPTEKMTPVAPAKTVTPPARTTTRLAATRTRPAPVSRSAEEAGVNTSATLPAAPQPYSSTTTAPTAPADPTTTAPAPAPAEAAPPVTAAPAPVATPPQ